MITAWTKNTKTPEEKDRLTNAILGSRVVLDRLMELMQEDEVGMNNREVGTAIYDLPNWELRVADANGYRRCLKAYMKLINLDQEDINAREFVRPNTSPTIIPTVGPN